MKKRELVYPLDPAMLLNRVEVAEALTHSGFPVAPATLATKATRGGGPPYRMFQRRRALYAWGAALAWAKAQMSRPLSGSQSERLNGRLHSIMDPEFDDEVRQ